METKAELLMRMTFIALTPNNGKDTRCLMRPVFAGDIVDLGAPAGPSEPSNGIATASPPPASEEGSLPMDDDDLGDESCFDRSFGR